MSKLKKEMFEAEIMHLIPSVRRVWIAGITVETRVDLR